MSPASALSSATRSSPRKASTLVTRVCSISLPSRLSDFRTVLGLIAPEWMRPVRMRPRNGSDSSVVTSMRNGLSASMCGGGTWRRMRSNSGSMSLCSASSEVAAQPWRADANKVGKSSCWSLASSAENRSNTSSCTWWGRASERSTLLISTIGRRPRRSALPSTNLVCGSGPSAASTSSTTPSTMERMRSTSPPKSAWPGVSTMLTRVPFQTTEVALARMVMPRSRSRSFESMARSATCWFSRKVPDCLSRQSTSVVLPWSTCAMIATLRMSIKACFRGGFVRRAYTHAL